MYSDVYRKIIVHFNICQELEAPRPEREEPPEPEPQAVQIVQQLAVSVAGVGEAEGGQATAAEETQALHFDAKYSPVDDTTLSVAWLHDGAPLINSNRYRLTNDFGYAALDINFLLAEDAGEYTLVVSNQLGKYKI